MAEDSFRSFVLDQLSSLPEVRARAMFGGHGLYSGDHFFGILDEGRVFFKVDDSNRAEYESRGMPAFSYEMKGVLKTMSYFEVPPEVLEERNEVAAWAQRALKAAEAKNSVGMKTKNVAKTRWKPAAKRRAKS
jgi:DNA transformation protein